MKPVVTIKSDEVEISDGYHTFTELYSHRIELFIVLCKELSSRCQVWRSHAHSDGSVITGWFVLGVEKEYGRQITYHLPDGCWRACEFAETLDYAPEFDGHTSDDVLRRLREF